MRIYLIYNIAMGQQLILQSGESKRGFVCDDSVPLGSGEDATKIIGSNIRAIDFVTRDTRCRTSAHCDDFQLIPTKSHLRYFGSIAENVEIVGGELESNGTMQGIFSSDGGYRKLVIRDRIITTESEHKCTLAGVLDDCVIGNLKDKHGNDVRIMLDNLRFGGGADGHFYALSFKDHKYGEVVTDQDIDDRRGKPWRKNTEYVHNFDLNLFYQIAKSIPFYPKRHDAIKLHLKACKAEYKRVNNNDSVKIALIVGHNSKSQGKAKNGTTEYKFNKQLANELVEEAKHNHIYILLKVFEREPLSSYSDQMRRVHKQIDSWGANISVELHFNAFSKPTAKGHEVLYYSKSKGGRVVAGAMDAAFDKYLQNKDRNRKPLKIGENGAYGLKVGKAKSILVEPFFASEIQRFMPGGDQRENLINAFLSFFENINKLENPVAKKRTAAFTDEEVNAILGMF